MLPTTNPWLLNGDPLDSHFYYGWQHNVNLDVLRVCKLWRHLDIKILYEQNRFRLTRKLSGLPGHPNHTPNTGDFLYPGTCL